MFKEENLVDLSEITEKLFELLPDSGVSMLVFDQNNNFFSSNSINPNLGFDSQFYGRVKQRLDDGYGPLIANAMDKTFAAFELAETDDVQLYAMIVFDQIRLENTEIFELIMNQSCYLAEILISQAASKYDISSVYALN